MNGEAVYEGIFMKGIDERMLFNLSNELLPDLPAYTGGRMSEHLYNGGLGRHALMNASHPEHPEWDQMNGMIARYKRSGFATQSTAYAGVETVRLTDGVSRFEVEKMGIDDHFLVKAVRQYAAHWGDQEDSPSLTRVVTETTEQDFATYVELLCQKGFSVTWENRSDDNVFYELRKGKRLIYAAYVSRTNTARFTDDPVSSPLRDFGDTSASADGTMQLCQFGMLYYPCTDVTMDAGMMYLLKLPDNSIFVVDGGACEQSNDATCAELMYVMRRLSRAPEDQPVRIACWFCTHGHDDHIDLFSKFLRVYHNQVTVERLMFNFPSFDHYILRYEMFVLFDRFHDYCPNALYLKPHMGQCFDLAGVHFEVLQAHEDLVGAHGDEVSQYLNDTSTILKVSYDGASFTLLGDMGKRGEDALIAGHSKEALQCTALQVAHHMYNPLRELYNVVKPEIALIPTSARYAIASKPTPCRESFEYVCRMVPLQNQYYASVATDVFMAKDGHFELVDRLPIIGGIFVGSLV